MTDEHAATRQNNPRRDEVESTTRFPEEKAMLDLGGTFTTFMDSLFGFLNEFLAAVFTGLTGFFNGLNVF